MPLTPSLSKQFVQILGYFVKPYLTNVKPYLTRIAGIIIKSLRLAIFIAKNEKHSAISGLFIDLQIRKKRNPINHENGYNPISVHADHANLAYFNVTVTTSSPNRLTASELDIARRPSLVYE